MTALLEYIDLFIRQQEKATHYAHIMLKAYLLCQHYS